jgi:hypothetical protein
MNPRPVKPERLSAPGLAWRPRSSGWVAYWVARKDIVAKGYSLKSTRLWPPSTRSARPEPDADEWSLIAHRCERLQGELLSWANVSPTGWDPKLIYDGTMASLVSIFTNDPDSPYKNLRYRTRKHYDRMLGYIVANVGDVSVPTLTFRDFRRWYERRSEPKEVGGPRRKGRGHGFITYVRIVMGFGAILKLAGCKDAREILAGMQFENSRRRTKIITPEQIVAVIAKAHEVGFPSIALAQALQDGCIVRQKDVIGEWIPQSEPGLSDVLDHGEKWLSGFRWEKVSPALVLEHRLSKSIRGRDNLADPDAGKTKEFDLTARPLIMAEIARIPEDHRWGPMVICEYSGRPWREKQFQEKWREIARAAGVPTNVQNRDTRAGGITDGRKKGASLEDMRHGAGHSQISTTAGYDRSDLDDDRKIATLRFSGPEGK